MISDSEKEQIKALIVPLMLSSDPKIRAQLGEALAVIGQHDFPGKWPGLLPELVRKLGEASERNDYGTVNGILGTANALFKRFRYAIKSDALYRDLKYILEGFAAPLLQVFMRTAALIDGAAEVGVGVGLDGKALRALFESQRLCCRIFFSLNSQELPEFFEDHMREWMEEFGKYLALRYPVLEDDGGADGVAVVDEVRSAVCENITLYMEKNEEEFAPYLPGFAQAVENLLVTVSTSNRDKLAVTAIKFLITVSRSVAHRYFEGDDRLLHICQKIVIPNVMLREADEELFEMNYVEFIRIDMEGSDVDTKRRIACELVKGIATHYREKIMGIVSSVVQRMLEEYARNPVGNWKYMDCTVYLVVSLATRQPGRDFIIATDLVDAQSFFTSVIVPVLQRQNVNENPILRAGALKVFTLFRQLLPKHITIALLPDLIRSIGAESNVVHSYAAICIEKLLRVKDDGVGARYIAGDINPFLLILMTNLFNAFKFAESDENEYLMRCIMVVLGVADITAGVADPCITGLTSILNEVCRNPKNPKFNHYLFESLAVLVRRACEKVPALITAFEDRLFPSIEIILGNDVTEFLPYTFQLLAQLLDLNTQLLPPYIAVFNLLLLPDSWKRSANVPALVRLLQAFLQKAPQELSQEGRLSQVLGIFNKLLDSPKTEDQGFFVLNTVVENLKYDVIVPYVSPIWTVLFTRLMKTPSVKFKKNFLIFASLFAVKHEVARLVDSMNAIQAGIFFTILEQVWIPCLKDITGFIELKLTSVASAKVICESPALLSPAAAGLWGKMLDSIVTLVSKPEEQRVDGEESEVPDLDNIPEYSAAFVRLHNAGKKEDDPLKDIKDPKEFLVVSLASLSAHSPGRFPQVISENLSPENQAALFQLCKTYKCAIV